MRKIHLLALGLVCAIPCFVSAQQNPGCQQAYNACTDGVGYAYRGCLDHCAQDLPGDPACLSMCQDLRQRGMATCSANYDKCTNPTCPTISCWYLNGTWTCVCEAPRR